MQRIILLVIVVVLLVVVVPAGVVAQDLAGTDPIVGDNNQLAINLYKRFSADNTNFIFSPASAYIALALLYGGARGETADQISSALGPASVDPAFHSSLRQLQAELAQRAAAGQAELTIANALWPQVRYPMLAEYDDFVRSYGAEISAVDYQGNAEGAREAINRWAAENTKNLIRNLLRDPPHPTTLLILANAIYFKGTWAAQFDPADTTPQPFYGESETTEVQLMYQEQSLGYHLHEFFHVVEIPYRGEELSMLVFLPTEGHDLTELETALTADSLREWTSELWLNNVHLSLPRFSLGSEFDLKSHLYAMSVTDLFDSQRADLSGIDGIPNWLFLGFMLQKAFVDVNEEGATAAAITVGGGCFPAGTLVHTSAGQRAIEEVSTGTLVRSYDWGAREWVLAQVTARQSISYRGDIITIRAGGETIEATGNHPFYVVSGLALDSRPHPSDVPQAERRSGQDGRWVSARDLDVGDLLMTRSAGGVIANAVSSRQDTTEVYNLTVDARHNYVVGGAGALVHNKGSAEPETAVFRADHPFIYMIRDNPTGAILFMGRVGTLGAE